MAYSVCFGCIGNQHLRGRLAGDAEEGVCDACGEKDRTISLAKLAEQIDDAFQGNYELTPYEQSPPAWKIFAEIAGIDGDLAGLIEDHLFEVYGPIADRQATENPYDYSTGFALCGTPLFWQDSRWQRFCETLYTRARHINADAMLWLEQIFSGLEDLQTWDATPVIRTIVPGDSESYFFRARVATNDDELGVILRQPMKEIGPPPSGQGRGGRLNSQGISVFYGALDIATCVSEIRPPVGTQVVVARFKLLRPLRFLDCAALDRLKVSASPFDPNFSSKRDQVHFLRTFSEQISRPVHPSDEAMGYLPTQVIAEYLAECLPQPIDGILYRSTQRGTPSGNVMLFNRSARVEPFPHHTHSIDLHIRWIDVDAEDFDDSISLNVRQIDPPAAPRPETPAHTDTVDSRLVSLRLELDTIAVHPIRAINYDCNSRRVYVGQHRI